MLRVFDHGVTVSLEREARAYALLGRDRDKLDLLVGSRGAVVRGYCPAKQRELRLARRLPHQSPLNHIVTVVAGIAAAW